MSTLTVDNVAGQKAILIQPDGTRWYVLYDEEGNAYTYHLVSYLGERGVHTKSEDGTGCEFVGKCQYNGASTGALDDESDIFQLLINMAYHYLVEQPHPKEK